MKLILMMCGTNSNQINDYTVRYKTGKDNGYMGLEIMQREWPHKRMRYCIKLTPSKQEIKSLHKNTELSFIPMEAVGEDGSLDLSRTRPIEDVENGYTFFRNDDVAIAKITPCFENGKGCIFRNLVHGYGFGTTELTVMRPRLLVPTYLYYLTISHRFRTTGIGMMQGSAGQKRVPDEYIRDYKIGLPTEAEQQAIAAFLDRETARIDALIQKKERMIELLKEKRIALITQAVTKGLDPNAPMKDSGIGWLGEVPKHWELLRIRNIVKPGNQGIKIGPFGSQIRSDILVETGYKIYGQENVINDDFSLGDRYIDEQTYRELFVCEIVPGDLLITMMGSSGQCKVLPEGYPIGIMDSHLIRLRTNSKVDTKYLELVIGSSVYAQHQIRLASKGSIMSGMNSSIIKDLLILVPSPIEQKQILAKVEKWMAKIDSLVKEITKTISLLREYRASLIHHAVTGKIDLRGYDAQAQ